MNDCTPKLLVGYRFVGNRLNHIGTGHKHIRGIANHENEIGDRR